MESLICMGIVAALSVIGGYVLGKFQFLLLNRAMHDISGTLMDYAFSLNTTIITCVYIVVVFIILYIDNLRHLKKTSAVQLMSNSKAGERTKIKSDFFNPWNGNIGSRIWYCINDKRFFVQHAVFLYSRCIGYHR